MNKWINYKLIGHTSEESERTLSLQVCERASEKTFTMMVPDVAGDRLQNLWVLRSPFTPTMEHCLGYLLFLDPRVQNEPPLIGPEQKDAVAALLAGANTPIGERSSVAEAAHVAEEKAEDDDRDNADAENDGDDADEGETSAEFRWQPEMSPPQVQLVYLLQELIRERLNKKIAVVVSAWDYVEEEHKTPVAICQDLYPMLSNYLAFESKYDVRYFGISAQGGPYPQLQMARKENPRHEERAYVIQENAKSSDLTDVFFWMLG